VINYEKNVMQEHQALLEPEALGLPGSGLQYQKIAPDQNYLDELQITRSFLHNTFKSMTEPEFADKNMHIQFINYGDTQLVYVLTARNDKYAVLVGQPVTNFGIVRQEYDNLCDLAVKNPREVVTPIYYYSDVNAQRELYIAPYLMQARCIASQDQSWGIYVPEPDYHFQEFTEQEKSIVNSCMIALLIKLFDKENNLGISACKIGGGDFVLEKEWSDREVTYESTLDKMKLIAARELKPMKQNDYIEHIKREFSQSTYYNSEKDRDQSIIINWKSRVPMTKEEIETGISLGLHLSEK